MPLHSRRRCLICDSYFRADRSFTKAVWQSRHSTLKPPTAGSSLPQSLHQATLLPPSSHSNHSRLSTSLPAPAVLGRLLLQQQHTRARRKRRPHLSELDVSIRWHCGVSPLPAGPPPLSRGRHHGSDDGGASSPPVLGKREIARRSM